jgi:hypothetical protein
MLNLVEHKVASGPYCVHISSLRSSELLAHAVALPNCDCMNSSVATDS